MLNILVRFWAIAQVYAPLSTKSIEAFSVDSNSTVARIKQRAKYKSEILKLSSTTFVLETSICNLTYSPRWIQKSAMKR